MIRLFRSVFRSALWERKGQGLVEFALVLPVFLLVTAGIVDLGRAVASYSQMANCAREGARAGVFHIVTDADILAAVNAQSGLLGTIPASKVTITPGYPRPTSGTVTVQVTYQYRPLVGILVPAVGASVNMSATSAMPIEW